MQIGGLAHKAGPYASGDNSKNQGQVVLTLSAAGCRQKRPLHRRKQEPCCLQSVLSSSVCTSFSSSRGEQLSAFQT